MGRIEGKPFPRKIVTRFLPIDSDEIPEYIKIAIEAGKGCLFCYQKTTQVAWVNNTFFRCCSNPECIKKAKENN